MADTTKAKKAPAKPRKTTAKTNPASADTELGVTENASAVAEAKPARTGKNSSKAEAKTVQVSSEEIARLAHRYWTERGHQHGNHEEDWYRAEQELRKRAS